MASPSGLRGRRGRAVAAALATVAVLAGLGVASGTAPTANASTARQTMACAADGFCEDFESQTGGEPTGRWSVEARDCSGTGTVTVDTAEAHSGTQSIRVDGGGGYCNHVFAGTSLTDTDLGDTVYVRFWVRHGTPLPDAHVTFAAMNDAGDADRDLRMGGQNGALQWNRESDDATLPEQSPDGVALSVPLPVDTWTCVEAQLDGAAGHVATWVDGELVEGLVADGDPTHDVDSQWLGRADWRPSLTDLRLGWESYGGDTDTLWFDDVAVGSSALGC